MNLIKKLLSPFLAFTAVCLVSIFWHNISILFDNQNNILGEYSENNHHQLNDTLRFICFIFLPLIIFMMSYALLKQKKIKTFKDILFEKENTIFIPKKNRTKFIYLLFFFLILIFKFFSLDLPDYKLDIFHEGQLLSGALNYDLKNELWIGSYLNTGLFYDILNTNFAWDIFGQKSIGSYRIFNLSLNYLFIFSVIIFIYYVTSIFKLSKEKENIFFILLSIFCFYFYSVKCSNFPNYRDLFSILFLIFLINALFLPNNKLKLLNFFLIGNLSVISILWSLDRGIFLNATIILLILIFIFKKKFFELSYIIFGIMFSWLILISIIGIQEFNAFISNSFNILKYNEMWNGLIHPQPLTDEKNSTRATKALVLFVINGIIIIKFFFKKNNELNLNSKIVLFLIFCLGIFYYKVGISRSDGGHIVIGSSINYILFVILFFYQLLKFNYNLKKNISTILILSFIIFQFTQYSLNNIFKFKSRVSTFIQKSDSFFLNNDYLEFINQFKDITSLENCIQSFNYDPTIYFILKKRSCTKFYQIFSIATESDQVNFINEIKSSKLSYLAVDNEKDKYRFPPKVRFPIINNYIKENFIIYKTINGFNILKKLDD